MDSKQNYEKKNFYFCKSVAPKHGSHSLFEKPQNLKKDQLCTIPKYNMQFFSRISDHCGTPKFFTLSVSMN